MISLTVFREQLNRTTSGIQEADEPENLPLPFRIRDCLAALGEASTFLIMDEALSLALFKAGFAPFCQ